MNLEIYYFLKAHDHPDSVYKEADYTLMTQMLENADYKIEQLEHKLNCAMAVTQRHEYEFDTKLAYSHEPEVFSGITLIFSVKTTVQQDAFNLNLELAQEEAENRFEDNNQVVFDVVFSRDYNYS